MLRFSVRELLLAVVIVSLAAAWWIRERQLNMQLSEAKLWQGRTGALEFALTERGQRVKWNFDDSMVCVRSAGEAGEWECISTDQHLPGNEVTTDWPWK